ncbi:uncharacterized protein LOC115319889 [Ixodes scapularis]|uniref:uncharacterized protein LOC115319889 n=1 Tax=Ixodes scapularis TaxID=6945 RepID=UPI001A9CC0DA|nr:uncharacterized protein LOC115319889 [Ixodes scapularis]
MCDPRYAKKTPEVGRDELNSTSIHTASKTKGSCDDNDDVLLQTFRGWLMTKNECCYIRGVIDSGSQRTFIREDVSRKFKLKVIGKVNLSVNAFGSVRDSERHERRLVEIELQSQYDNQKHRIEAIEVPVICKDIDRIPMDNDFVQKIAKEKKYLADVLVFPGVQRECGISLLVGADQLGKLLEHEVCWDENNRCLSAVKTTMGWTFQGPVTSKNSRRKQTSSNVCVLRAGATGDDEVSSTLRQFWELESLGIKDSTTNSAHYESVLRGFEETITMTDGRYQVALPWKSQNLGDLGNNRKVAEKRLQGLCHRLARDEELLLKCFYVDDLIVGVSSYEEAQKLYDDSTEILAKAGMRLQKWSTSSRELKCHIEKTADETSTCAESSGLTKVLGILWDTEQDNLQVNLQSLSDFVEERMDTKRFVLQTTSRLFDPLGLLSPYSIRAKILFQHIWEKGIDWDTSLANDLREEWLAWCGELVELGSLSVDRCFLVTEGAVKSRQLHVFTDASTQAYGAVAYMRVEDTNGNTSVRLVMSKARVAPLKKMTLPRLELLGALIGSRLMAFLIETLDLPDLECHLWTDSTITLSWIQALASKWKPFVCNRVVEIQSNTDPLRWRHCSGKDNPADMLTRGVPASNLTLSKVWWQGPQWLSRDPDFWPQRRETNDEVPDADAELRGKSTVLLSKTTVQGPLLVLTDYSKWLKAMRVTAWIMRFIKNLQGMGSRVSGSLSTNELEGAERYWTKHVQGESYSEEKASLVASDRLRSSSRVRDLHPFLDEDGVIRIETRLQNVSAPDETKFPVLLPGDNRFTELLVEHTHVRICMVV